MAHNDEPPLAVAPSPPPDESSVGLPAHARFIPWFGLFNAVSWQIVLGTPVILYAKSLGASATVLGVIFALTPLLVVAQIPAARWMETIGYKRLILAGWGSRTVVLFAIAVVPLCGFLPAWGRLVALVGLLLVFNLFRGIAAGAWMPWISELIPRELRGRFLAREQMFAQAGSLVAMLGSAVVLAGSPAEWQFTVAFAVSAGAAVVSLVCIRRVPDVMHPDLRRQTGHRVPWGHMVRWPPFARLMGFGVAYLFVTGGMGVFTVAFMRGVLGYAESRVLVMSAVAVAGALAATRAVGRFVDRAGSRPVLRACTGVYALVAAGWWAIAAGVVPGAPSFVAVLNLLMGAVGVSYYVAHSRLDMATIPVMGRNHFFAILTVVSSLALGAAPIGWGAMLDLVGGDFVAVRWGVAWNRYSFYFAAIAALAAACTALVAVLHEPPYGRPADDLPVVDPSSPSPAGRGLG